MRVPPLKLHLKLSFTLVACILALTTCIKFVGAQKTTRQGAVDWIFVLDTSASMRGADGAKNIFDKVKDALAEFIRSTRPGDSVTLYTFDRDTKMHPTVLIADETDKRDLLSLLQGVEANGDRTHTGKAIHDALMRAGELKARSEATGRVASIILLTDGIEDVRGIPNPTSIPSNVKLIANSQPYIFFVSLGQEHDQQLEDFVKNPALGGRGEVIRDPGAENIGALGDRIRTPIEEAAAPTPTPTPTPINIQVEPASLDFGRVEAGASTARQTLNIRSNTAVNVMVTLEDLNTGGVRLTEPDEAVAIKAGESVPVNVQLRALDDAADGLRTFTLKLTPQNDSGPYSPETVITPASVNTRLTIYHTALWYRLLKWFALFLMLLLVGVGLYSLYQGDTPWALWHEMRNRKNLEGELEMLHPLPSASDDHIINLGRLGTNRVKLSSLLPDGVTADADAELTTAFRNGVKFMQLHRLYGSISIDRTEVAYADLYDSDIIELGDARLRFNWLGHERPIDSEEHLS